MTITALPTPPARTDAPATFISRADAFIAALPTFVTETNATAAQMTAAGAGGAFSMGYTFSTTTTDSDPGTGTLRLSNATQNASTVIRLDLLDTAGTDQTANIDTFDDSTSTLKGFIRISKVSDGSKWLTFSVSSLASPSGYKNLTVTNVGSSAASPFSNGDALTVAFTRAGDKGDTGATGGGLTLLATVTPTAAASVDFLSTFSATYDNYLILGSGLTAASADTLRFRFAVAGSPDTGSNYYIAPVGSTGSSAGTVGAVTGALNGSNGCSFVMHINNANDASGLKMASAVGVTHNGAGYTAAHNTTAYVAANTVSGVRFIWDTGVNFGATGKIRVYGYHNS